MSTYTIRYWGQEKALNAAPRVICDADEVGDYFAMLARESKPGDFYKLELINDTDPGHAQERDAIIAIHVLLDGQEWSADTLDRIAEIVRRTGREVRDLDENDYVDGFA